MAEITIFNPFDLSGPLNVADSSYNLNTGILFTFQQLQSGQTNIPGSTSN